MPSNKNKKIQNIEKVLGTKYSNLVYELIENEESVRLYGLANVLNIIGNYTEIILKNAYNLLSDKKLDDIISEWNLYYESYKNSYSFNNYVEHNKIICDYRKDEIGFYWVDLETQFCMESMIGMEDCGRVNYGNTTLELREQTLNSTDSCMIIVYGIYDNNIRQVKGKCNSKPNRKYWDYFYKFLIDSDYKVNEYIPTYNPKNDLLVSDLDSIQQSSIYSKHPNLLKTKNIL